MVVAELLPDDVVGDEQAARAMAVRTKVNHNTGARLRRFAEGFAPHRTFVSNARSATSRSDSRVVPGCRPYPRRLTNEGRNERIMVTHLESLALTSLVAETAGREPCAKAKNRRRQPETHP